MEEIKLINLITMILTGSVLSVFLVIFTWYCVKEKAALKKWESEERSSNDHSNKNDNN